MCYTRSIQMGRQLEIQADDQRLLASQRQEAKSTNRTGAKGVVLEANPGAVALSPML